MKTLKTSSNCNAKYGETGTCLWVNQKVKLVHVDPELLLKWNPQEKLIAGVGLML